MYQQKWYWANSTLFDEVRPTDIDRAKHARDQARIEHDAASAASARLAVIPEVTASNIRQANQRLINARSVLYAADAKLAALVRDADIKERAEEIEVAKREKLERIDDVVGQLDDEDYSTEYHLDREWSFLLDEMGERDLIASVKGVLRAYRERVVAS